MIEASRLFDERWYRLAYDVSGDRTALVRDYLTEGRSARRRPNPLFDGEWYLDTYQDVRWAGLHPLQHYLDSGAAEGRWPSPWFQTQWYLKHPECAGVSPTMALEHFLEQDWRDLPSPNPLFDMDWYVGTYPDVPADDMNPLVHFAIWGSPELRDPNPLFSSSWYAQRYPDVVSAGAVPLVHFQATGWRENRIPHPLFDTAWYRARYALPVTEDPLAHYLHEGHAAGCVTRPENEPSLYAPDPGPGSVQTRWLGPALSVTVDAAAVVIDSKPWRGGIAIHRPPATSAPDPDRTDAPVLAYAIVPADPDRDLDDSLDGDAAPVDIALRGPWVLDVDWLRPGPAGAAAPSATDAALDRRLRWLLDLQHRIPAQVASGWQQAAVVSEGNEPFAAGALGVSPDSLVCRWRPRGHLEAANPTSAPIRVLLVSHEASLTGAPIYLEQCALALQDAGAEVLVVSLRDDMHTDVFRRAGVPCLRLIDARPVDGGERATGYDWLLTPLGEASLSGIIAGFRPHVAVVNSIVSSDACRVLFQHGIPHVLQVHETFGWSGAHSSAVDPYERAIVNALGAADQVLFGSEQSRDLWALPGHRPRGHVLRTARMGPRPGAHAARTHGLRTQLHIDEGAFVFLSIATFEPRKRIEDILDAFERMDDDRAALVLVGDPGTGGEISDRVSAGVARSSRIISVPPSSDLAAYYAMADALVFASAEETYPLVLQEAAHAGLPRIVSRFPGWEESVSDSSALLFDVRDVATLQACMTSCIDDRERCEALAAAGRAEAADTAADWERTFLDHAFGVLGRPRVVVAPRSWL
jgi:glycosyltransferase involved in cell wall biosynthesis